MTRATLHVALVLLACTSQLLHSVALNCEPTNCGTFVSPSQGGEGNCSPHYHGDVLYNDGDDPTGFHGSLGGCRTGNYGCSCEYNCRGYGDCCKNFGTVCEFPVIDAMTPTSGDTSGNDEITITGQGFLTVEGTVSVGAGSCDITSWTDSQILCNTPAGSGATNAVKVLNVNGKTSNGKNFAYDRPDIDSIEPTTAATVGGAPITLTGTSFSADEAQVIFDGVTLAASAIVSRTHDEVIFSVPAGEGRSKSVELLVNGQRSNLKQFSYNPPSISSPPSPSPANGPTAGVVSIELVGSSFGTSPSVTVGGATCLSLSEVTHGRLLCSLPPGQGVGRQVRVSTAGQLSNVVSFNYDRPDVTSITPATGPTGVETVITLEGLNFGQSGTITVGTSNCPIVSGSYTDTEVRCRVPPGEGEDLPVVLRVAGQTADIVTFSYDAPSIGSVSPLTGPTQGGNTLEILGDNFGFSPSVTVGGAPCLIPDESSSSHNFINCTVPEGQGNGHDIVVSLLERSVTAADSYSYTSPDIDSISPTSGPTSGSLTLTLHGTNFGTSGTVTVDSKACNPTGSGFTHTQVTCFLPVGAGQNREVFIDVSGNTDTFSPFNYNPPSIHAVSPLSGPTSGGVLFTVQGASFGKTGSVRVHGEPCPTQVFGHSNIICQLPPGSGSGLVEVTAQDGRTATWPFTYGLPAISTIFPNSGSTAGGTNITISGSSFESAATPGSVLVHESACSVVSWSHTSILCTTPSGVGDQRLVTVETSSGESTSDLSATFSYLPPSVSGISPAEGATENQVLQISGQNFGADPSTATVYVGASECAPVAGQWSHTQIRCTVAPGEGRNYAVQVVVEGQSSSQSVLFSFTAPQLTTVAPTVGATAGGEPLVLSGFNFGLNPTVFVGGNPCPLNTSETQTHSRLVCSTPAGQGQFKTVQVVAGSQLSNGRTFSYDGPSISDVDPRNGPTSGGTRITITGASLGTSGLVTVGGVNCDVVPGFHTDQEIQCITRAGEGKSRWVQAFIAAVPSNILQVFNFDSPTVDSVTPDSGPTTGSTSVVIRGTNFGLSGTARIGGSLCDLQSRSHTQIVCRTPEGSGRNQSVQVSVLGTPSTTRQFHYNPPNITDISPRKVDSSGAVALQILGTNFGRVGSVTVGGRVCSPTGTGFAQTTITCFLPAGQGSSVVTSVTVGDQTAESTLFGYNRPRITELLPSNGPTGGDKKITVKGASFGLSGSVLFGEEPCPVVPGGYTHGQIVCTLPVGSGSQDVVVTSGDQSSDSVPASLFSYDRPSVFSIVPRSGPTQGQITVTVSGSSFDASGTVSIGGRQCNVLTWSHSETTCTLPAGFGRNNVVRITSTVSGLASTETWVLFDYAKPQIVSISPTTVGTSGTETLVLTGTGFGTSPTASDKVLVGSSECTKSPTPADWNHTEIRCLLPKIEGAGVRVSVTYGSQRSNDVALGVFPPKITKLVPTSGDSSGGITLTLTGSNFGTSPQVTVATAACPIIGTPNATTVFCSLPPGQGTNQPVTIRALGQLSNELLFTYNGPTINGTYPSAGPTAGNITLAITGTSLGTSGLVTVGGSNCPTSLHTSTRVECTLPAGEGVGREIRIIVASKTSNAWPFSYQAPTITDVDPLSADSSGGSVVTVRGTNFGTSGFATIGGRTCTPTSQVLDHSEIRCRVPEGDGAVNDVAVHVATQSSDPYGLPFSYDVPDVQSVTPAVGPTVGGTVLTVRGSSFGTSGQVTVGSQLCPIVPSSYDHDVVRCYLPEGQGGNLPVVVESNEQVSSGDTKFSYSVPRLTSLSPTNGPTLGGVVITLTGSHFGTTGSVTINNAPCALAQAGYDHSHIECSLPAGSGFNLDVVVRSAGQNSSALTFRYDTPKIDSYTTQGDSKSTAGGYVLTLFGSNLNGVPAAVTVSVDGRDCPVTYANHDEVRCTMPIGSGKGNQIVATVGSQGSNVLTFDYAAPVVSSVTADEASGCTNSSGAVTDCSIASGGQLVVTGSNFFDGSGGTLTTVTVGSLSCDNVVHDSVSPHTMLTCDIPANAAGGFNLPVKVQVNAQSGSAALFSYAGPEILPNTLHLVSDPGTVGSVVVDTSSAATDPHRSTVTVSFRTRNFGSDASAITVSYGSATDKPYECSGVSLGVASGNERDLVCQLEHGAGSGLVFSAQVGAQASIDSVDTLTYSPTPQITSGTLRLANGGVGTTDLTGTSTEGELIRFDGLHFGALGAPQLRVMYGVQGSGLFDLECTNAVVTAGADESGTIECLTSPGEGSDYVFQVSVLGSTSVLASTPDTYSYPVAPIVFSVTGCSVSATNANATVDCPTEGGTEISITGDNFAASNASTSVRVGVSPCVILRFEADSTRIVCRLAQGVGFSKNVRVIVGKLFSRPKALLSYSSPLVTSVSGCTASASTPSTTIDCPRAPGTPTRITLLGQYFGASDAQVLVGGQNCGNVVHSSTTPHRELSCDLPSGKGINRVVMVIQDRGEAAATAGLGRVSYVRCVAGQYDVPGSLQCAACPRGSFTATSGQQQCRQCESGYFAASPQSTVCELCARGRFSQRSTNATTGAIVGPSACTECSPGEFASGLGESACSECVIGEYTANNGSEACTSCAEGKFAADTGADTCEPCEAGEFAAGVGAFGCDSCLPGTYSAAAQASACETCEVGKFQDRSGRSECTSCPIGSAMPSSGQIECDQCDSGFFSNDTGLDQCLTCPAGSISVKTGAIGPTECTPCPAGRFISVGGQSICLLCFRGTAQASEGSSSCDTCETGRFASTPGSSECTDCAEGTFASTEGQETCEPCATGKFAVGERNTLCTLCAAGTYQDATSQSSCTNCTAGSAVSTEGRSSPCDQCPSGQFAPTSGMVSCKRCPAGSKSVNTGADLQGPTECALCDAGRFASATGQASCTACPAGQFASVAGSTACSACAPGNFSATSGSILCEPCPEGQFATNDGSITCEDCPVGTRANTTGSVQCSQCPVGTAQGSSGESTCETCRAGTFAESEASSLCLECPPGSVSAEGSSQCTECEAGQYQPLAGQDACLECPEGTFTDASGAVACTECSQGEIAATSGLSECTPCDAGTFAAAVRSSVCTNCFSGSYTSSPGAFECEAAPVGRYVPEESATASIACSKGYFQDATGQSSCKPCANGTFINVAGQAACVQCASGFYADRPGRSTCAACRPGTFATNAGQANCEPCEVGHFAQGFGAIECDSCNPGQFADEVGSEECTPCPAGKFADQLASDACTDCAEGTAATSQGATSCPPCSDGFFANVTGMQSCLPCAEGYFSRAISSGQGAEECTACDPGRFQSATGQSQCIRCPRGFEAPEAAAAACTPCEAGYVAEVEGTEECEPCARGRFAQSSGQALCAACPVGRASNTSAATECPKCGTGFAQDEVGKIECEACEAGTFANVEGLVQCETCPIGTQSPAQADSCTSCPAGSYQSASGSETCLPCPLGRAVSSSGAALCPQCALGKFSGRLGGEQCVSCEPGQFANSPGSTVCGNCTGGSFSSVPGSFECSECPAGKYSVRPDSRVGPLLSSCTDCPRGMYQSFTGETRCLLCPAGSATKVEGSRACKACPLGTFATEDGSEECTECPTGKASNVGSATSCLNCTAGFFANLAGSITCEPCAPGSVSGEGVTECTPCKVGYFQSAQGQLTCEPCEAGTANALSGQSACFTCAAGKFSNTTAATRCEVCAAGTFNQAAVGATSCEPCSAGTFLGASGQDRCEQCPLGYISTSEGSLSCEPCREGTIADQPGSTECEVCSAGRFAASQAAFVCRACAAGRFAATNSSSGCSACPTGKYVGDAGRTQCFECPLGRHAKGEGTISCAVCQPGRFMNSTGATVCSACPKGRHQPAAGQTNCVDCEAGRFSDSSGLPDCLLCPTGRYETQNRSDECTDCNPGSFQQQAGQVGCDLCPAGRFQIAQGEFLCVGCPTGRFNDDVGQLTCRQCPPGRFTDQVNSTRCWDCPEGRFASGNGTATCDLCPPGSFGNTTAQTECDQCAVGRHQDEAGQIECVDCVAGKFSSVPGSIDCRSCPLGRYEPDPQSTECTRCETGRFSPVTGAEDCVDCRLGEFSGGLGQAQCDICPAGRYGDELALDECKECQVGRHANRTGAQSCDPCTPGRFASVRGLVTCDGCKAGRFTSTTLQTQCTACGSGKSQPLAAQSGCVACGAGKFKASEGAKSCDLCAAGWISPLSNADRTKCLACPVGTYMPFQGHTGSVCTACPSGRHAQFVGRPQCSACARGKFSVLAQGASVGAVVCTDCDKGKFAGTVASSRCGECAVGRFASAVGREACQVCEPGSVGNSTGLTNCTLCPAGKYQGLAGQAECIVCERGTFSASPGAVACDPCPPGSVVNVTGATECTLCDVGSHAEEEGMFECDDCVAGRFAQDRGLAQCTLCAEGTFSTQIGRDRSCVPCPPGSFSNGTGGTGCELCSPGYVSPVPEQALCTPCAVGSYQPDGNRTVCLACGPGRFVSKEAATECEDCGVGQFQGGSGQGECVDCPAGSFADEPRRSSCTRCPIGKHAAAEGASECTSCIVGRYANATGLVNCELCERGTYGPSEGLTECVTCESGSEAPNLGQRICQPCSPGRFAENNTAECVTCPPLSVAPSAGAAYCQACDKLSVANALRTRCLCEVGYYADDEAVAERNALLPRSDRTQLGLCKECPFGARCDEVGVQFSTMETRAGFWRADTRSTEFYACPRETQCLGGRNSSCKPNHLPPLCGVCAEGYYSTARGNCALCPPKAAAVVSFLIMTAVVVVLLMLQFWILLRSGQELMSQAKRIDDRKRDGLDEFDEYEGDSNRDLHQGPSAAKMLRTPEGGLEVDDDAEDDPWNQDSDDETKLAAQLEQHSKQVKLKSSLHQPPPPEPSLIYKMKIAIGFVQIMTNLSFSADVPWPSGYKEFIAWFNVLNFDFIKISSVECVFETNYYRKFLIVSVSPIILFFTVALVYFVPKYFQVCFRDDSAESRKRSRRRFWRMFIFTLFLIYPTVSSTVLRLYVCKNIEGENYLVSDLRVKCDTEKHDDYERAGVLMILIYPFGIPLFLLYMLFKYRHKLDDFGVRAQLGFLYDGYFHEFWWFELVDMFHKLFLVALLAFIDVDLQLEVGMAVVISYLVLLLLLNPYIRDGDDRLHQLAQVEIFLLLLSVHVFEHELDDDAVLDGILSAVLIGLALTFFAFFVPQAFWVVVKMCVRKWACLGRRLRNVKKVQKWLRSDVDRERAATMLSAEDIREIQEGRSVIAVGGTGGRRNSDEHDGVKLQRNPAYDATAGGTLIVNRDENMLRGVELVANPMMRQYRVEYREERDQLVTTLDQVAPLNLRSSAADRLERPQLGQAQLGEDEMPATVLEQQKKRSQKRREARKDFAMVRPHQKPTEPGT